MSFCSDEDLTCPVCRDIFRDPVVLSCSHSFCRICLDTWWTGNPAQACPVCKRRSSRSEPPSNLALKNLCRTFVLQRRQRTAAGTESMCSLHCEKLKLFCLDHQQPACLVCRDSKTHSNHRFRPIHELAQEHREELQDLLKPLQQRLKLYQRVADTCDQMAAHIQVQAQRTERRIREHFEKLHRFLQEEEEARISALREEEEQKSRRVKEEREALSRDTVALSSTIRAAEDQLGAEDAAFLLNYKAALEAVQQRPLLEEEPRPPSAALIDEAKHLGNLTFSIWNRMRDLVSYTPVILDPNTANAEFVLSEDLTSVRHGERRKLPENPERVDYHRSVRGREGFSSGIHTWDVDVRDNPAWFVGAAAEFDRAEQIKSGFWQIEFYNSRYSARMWGDSPAVLRLRKRLHRIRVYLDWNRGKLSFFDPDGHTHIHTFTHTFTERLFPCLGTLDHLPLKIMSGKISVSRDDVTGNSTR